MRKYSPPFTAELAAATTLTELTIDNIKIDGNQIEVLDTDGNLTLIPDGTGHVDINTPPASEASGININGTTYDSALRVNDIGGGVPAQTILHRHSTTLEPVLLGARANSDTDSHADVTNGQSLLSIYGAGYAGSNYKLFGQIVFEADDTGTVSNSSSPGKMLFNVTPDASVTPATWLTVNNDKTASFAGDVDVTGTLSVDSINMEQTVNAQTGTTYTLVAADNRKLITFSNASDITVTLPQQSTLTTVAGFSCKFLNIGAGTVTFIKEGSETLIGNTLAATNAGGSIERPSTTSWEIFGGTAIVNSPALGPVMFSISTSQTKIFAIVQANCTLLGFSQRCFSIGTAGTYDIQLNGVDITGLTGIVPVTAGSVESVTTATNLVAGDVISVVADGTLATIADLLLVPNFTETF
jgi:hypothetical protein